MHHFRNDTTKRSSLCPYCCFVALDHSFIPFFSQSLLSVAQCLRQLLLAKHMTLVAQNTRARSYSNNNRPNEGIPQNDYCKHCNKTIFCSVTAAVAIIKSWLRFGIFFRAKQNRAHTMPNKHLPTRNAAQNTWRWFAQIIWHRMVSCIAAIDLNTIHQWRRERRLCLGARNEINAQRWFRLNGR